MWDLWDGLEVGCAGFRVGNPVLGWVSAGMGVFFPGMGGFWAGLFCWSDNVLGGFRSSESLPNGLPQKNAGEHKVSEQGLKRKERTERQGAGEKRVQEGGVPLGGTAFVSSCSVYIVLLFLFSARKLLSIFFDGCRLSNSSLKLS